jgi:hypothetical protein
VKIEDIARVCHEANRAYCVTLDDDSQPPWDDASKDARESSVQGVMAILEGKTLTPKDSHDNWYRRKATQGWRYGPVKDVDLKVHPCFLPYEQLPEAQKVKDALFFGVVLALMDRKTAVDQHPKVEGVRAGPLVGGPPLEAGRVDVPGSTQTPPNISAPPDATPAVRLPTAAEQDEKKRADDEAARKRKAAADKKAAERKAAAARAAGR